MVLIIERELFMKNIKYGAIFCMVSGSLCAVQQHQPVVNGATKSETMNVSKSSIDVVLPIPKQLQKPQMKLLNTVFENKPMTSVRTKLAYSNAYKVLKSIDTLRKAQPASTPVKYFKSEADEKTFILGSLKLVLDPVRKFLEDVHKYGNIISPLVVESLGEDNKNSLFLSFFQSKNDIELFFEYEVTTIDALQIACIEFITVFGDMFASLSEYALKGYADMIKKLKEEQAAKCAQKTPAKV